MRTVLLIMLGLSSACRVDVVYSEGLMCSISDPRCPPGQSCFNGTCRLGGPGDDDAATSVDAGPLRACGGSAGLVEDFSDDVATWWLDPDPQVGISYTDAMTLSVQAGLDGETARVFTAPRLDLIESRFFARVDPAADGVTTFRIQGERDTDDEIVEIRMEDGRLYLGVNDRIDIAFDPDQHRFWGFRHLGQTLYLETSADGVDFEIKHRVAAPNYLSRFQAGMLLERRLGGDAMTTTFDDFNGGGPTSEVFCSSGDRSDDFEDQLLGENWELFGLGCDVSYANGKIVFAPPPVQRGCTLAWNNLFDLNGSAFVVEFDGLTAIASFGVRGEYGRFLSQVLNGRLRVLDCPNDVCVTVGDVAYNAQQFFRFRGTGPTTVAFEISSNGIDYVQVGTASSDLQLGAVSFVVNVGSGESVSIEQFN